MIAVSLLPDVVSVAPDLFNVTDGLWDTPDGLSTPLRLILLVTALSLVPAILVAMTAFTRIIIVLAMLRQALGMPETPPTVVLLSLALFLTAFTMAPVVDRVNEVAVQPILSGEISEVEGLKRASVPVSQFMVAQTRDRDLALVFELSESEMPDSIEEVPLMKLVPAFMLSELRRAFEIGFVLFLPFVAIDLIVASVLMALGMIMVPPLAFSLPLKILMFVLIDGWALLASSLFRSFNAF